MGRILVPGLPEAEPAAEPWPVDEHTIRVDEMFARRLDTEFASGVRDLLHHPETAGLSHVSFPRRPERSRLNGGAVEGPFSTVHRIEKRSFDYASLRSRAGITPPETTEGSTCDSPAQNRDLGLPQRTTIEIDDASVAERLAGLNQDAATAWRDQGYLRKLGRTAVNELGYQGERRGWDATETDARVRGGLSDLYAGAVETAIRQNDLDGAAGLYDHARPVIDPERQAAIDQRFARAREVALYRDIDRDLADLPLEPAGPPGQEVFQQRAAQLTPENASDEVRARIGQVAAFAQRRAERQWNKQQAEAGVAALDWVRKSPEASLVAMPSEVRDWLAPDQWRGLETLATDGRLRTDDDLFDRLDRQMVYQPDSFAGVDLDRHRLSLDDTDYTRFAGAQKAIAEGRIDPDLARYDRLRLRLDRALEALDIDTDSPVAVKVRADARDQLKYFEAIEGHTPSGAGLDDIARRAVDSVSPGAEWQVAQADPLPYFPSHMWTRMQQRGLSPSQLTEALNSGVRILQPNGNTMCIGSSAIVVLSPSGGYVTCFPR